MRFFSGDRSADKKNSRASELFKRKATGKTVAKTASERFDELVEEKMHKMMEDTILGRKRRPMTMLPGVKQPEAGAEKEMSKTMLWQLKMLSIAKVRKEMAKEKSAQRAVQKKLAAKKSAALLAKAAADAQIEEEKRAAEAAVAAAIAATAAAEAAAQAAAHHSSHGDDNTSSWW